MLESDYVHYIALSLFCLLATFYAGEMKLHQMTKWEFFYTQCIVLYDNITEFTYDVSN